MWFGFGRINKPGEVYGTIKLSVKLELRNKRWTKHFKAYISVWLKIWLNNTAKLNLPSRKSVSGPESQMTVCLYTYRLKRMEAEKQYSNETAISMEQERKRKESLRLWCEPSRLWKQNNAALKAWLVNTMHISQSSIHLRIYFRIPATPHAIMNTPLPGHSPIAWLLFKHGNLFWLTLGETFSQKHLCRTEMKLALWRG